MLTVTFEVGTIIITILLLRKQTQRSGVASAAQSQAARKGGARLQTHVNCPLLMLLPANTLTAEWLLVRGTWQPLLLDYPTAHSFQLFPAHLKGKKYLNSLSQSV